MDKLTILNKHLEFKKTSVHSKEKLKDIERYLLGFLNSSNKPLEEFNENDLAKFLNSLTFKTRTINDIKQYLKVFIKWYFSDWSSKFRNLEKLCKSQKPSQAYQPEQMIGFNEVEKIVQYEKDLMWKVFWLTLFYGGFRPSECCSLKWNNVYFEDEGVIIKLHTTKTNKDFYKSLPENAEHLLKEWKNYNQSEFLFPSPLRENAHIHQKSVYGRLVRISKKVLNKHISPYILRHSIATILYSDDNRKDDDTANQLGHTKNMKSVYMNLDEQKIKSKARSLWIKTKELTKEEQTKVEDLKKMVLTLSSTLENAIDIISNNKSMSKKDGERLVLIANKINSLQK